MSDYGIDKDWSNITLPGPVREGRGRTAVRLQLVAQGRDLVLLIGGGDTHVGAAATAAGDGGSDLAVLPPHKEGPLAAECAALVARAAGCSCAAVAGIHQDSATADEIAAIVANARRAATRLAEALATSPPPLPPLEAVLAGWAREAATIALEYWRRTGALAFKAGREAVTAADLSIEEMLRERIAEAFPGDTVVGEELGGHDPGQGRVWHLDPIDGTLNFALGLPGFCTSIALLEDGRPTAACVAAPVSGDLWTACRGGGARRNGQLMAVSDRTRLADAVISTQMKKDGRGAADPRLLRDLLTATMKLRKTGAIALELARVADGAYDALVADFGGPIALYDVAAGLLLVEEAGGRVTDHEGAPWRRGGPQLIAGNGRVNDELVALLGRRG